MQNHWPIKSIAECAAPEPYSTQIGPFGKALMADEYTSTGVPVLRGINVNRGRFHDDDFVFVSDETANRLSKFESYPDDVLLVHKGTLGEIGLMPKVRKYRRYIMGNSMLRVRCDPKQLLPQYLYYWLSSAQGKHYLLSRVSQVGVPQIQRPLTTLREAKLPVPPLSEQRAITHVLGTLDDKIELNRQMNETLEAIAQALFKSRFVAPIQDGLPEGWRRGTLGEVGEVMRRTVGPKHFDPDTPYIGLEHMPRRCIALSEWGHAGDLESNKFEFKRAEILFGRLRPYFHKVGVAPIAGVCSTDILVIRPKEPDWFGFALGHISSSELVNHTDAASTGTKMPRAHWNDIARYEVALPPRHIAGDFTHKIRPMVERIINNIQESSTLRQLRDILLPQLLTAKCAVDAEILHDY
jgi:type I restriction enzyme, S subunit